jgi:cyclic-di-GMP-binding protein
MSLLQLDVPQRRVNDAGAYHVNLRELRVWIDALPYGDALGAGQTLLTTLQELNRSELKRDGRLEPVRILWVAVARLLPVLRKFYIKAALPLGARELQAFQLAYDLVAEAAHGFKLSTLERLDVTDEASRLSDKPLLLALQRAMVCLSWLQLECYNTYRPVPPFVWRDFYHLFELAERYSMTEQALPSSRADDQAGTETSLSVLRVFSRAVALALANPFNVLQGESEFLFRVLTILEDTVALGTSERGRAESGFFADFSADMPPRLMEKSNGEFIGMRPRKILLSGVAHSLRHAGQAELLPTEVDAHLPVNLREAALKRAGELLMPQRGRTELRAPSMAKLVLVCGLGTIHPMLGAQLHETPDETERTRRNDGTPLLSEWPRAKPFATEPPLEADRWMRKNQSRGGLLAFCPTRPTGQLRAGDLAVYAEPSAWKQTWALANVRWLKTRANGGLDVGLKTLGSAHTPLFVRAIRGQGVAAGYARALLADTPQGIRLITAAGLFDASSTLVLNFGHALGCGVVTKVEMSSHLFVVLEISLLPQWN